MQIYFEFTQTDSDHYMKDGTLVRKWGKNNQPTEQIHKAFRRIQWKLCE